MLKNFYNKIKDEESFNNSLKLNQEVIAYQNDPTFISKACKAIENIFTLCDHDNKYANSKEGKAALMALEKVFTDRFGIKFIVGVNDWGNAFCMTSTPNTEFDLGDFTNLQAYFKRLDREKNRDKGKYITDEEDMNIDNPKLRNQTLQDASMGNYYYYNKVSDVSYLSFLNKVNTGGFKIDLKNAKILNPGKNQYIYINADFYYFYVQKGLSSKEVLAILLHETGHGWNELERITNFFGNVFLLNDLLIEEYGKKEKSPIEVANIFYSKTGLPRTKSNSKNMTDVSVTILKDIARGSIEGLETAHTYTNHEQLADEFASRFGLGAELVSGLKAIGVGEDVDERNMSTQYFLCSLYGSLLISTYIACFTGSFAIILGGLGFGVALGLYLFVATSAHYYSQATIYDTAVRRVRRIRNTTVRRLAAITDKKVKADILRDLELLDEAKAVIEDKATLSAMSKFSKYLGGLFEPKAKQEFLLNELIEDMSANEINVALAKWDTRRV